MIEEFEVLEKNPSDYLTVIYYTNGNKRYEYCFRLVGNAAILTDMYDFRKEEGTSTVHYTKSSIREFLMNSFDFKYVLTRGKNETCGESQVPLFFSPIRNEFFCPACDPEYIMELIEDAV